MNSEFDPNLLAVIDNDGRIWMPAPSAGFVRVGSIYNDRCNSDTVMERHFEQDAVGLSYDFICTYYGVSECVYADGPGVITPAADDGDDAEMFERDQLTAGVNDECPWRDWEPSELAVVRFSTSVFGVYIASRRSSGKWVATRGLDSRIQWGDTETMLEFLDEYADSSSWGVLA